MFKQCLLVKFIPFYLSIRVYNMSYMSYFDKGTLLSKLYIILFELAYLRLN